MSQASQQVRMLLLSRRRMDRRKDGSFPAFKAPATSVGWPAAIQASYAKALVEQMQGLNRVFFPEVRRLLPGWIAEVSRRHDADDVRLDGFFLDLTTIKDKLLGHVKGMFGPKSGLTVAVFGTAKKEDAFHKRRVTQIIEDATKGSYYPAEPWVEETLAQWREANFGLVRSLTTEYVEKMNETVQSAVTSGKTYQDVMDDLLRMGQTMTVSRAKLIAVDQLGKLHGALTKARFSEAGLELYEWRCSLDERVRGNPRGKYAGAIPSHWAAHGMICTWKNDSTYRPKGTRLWAPRPGNVPRAIPGYPIRCRCHANPVWDDLVASVDAELQAEGV